MNYQIDPNRVIDDCNQRHLLDILITYSEECAAGVSSHTANRASRINWPHNEYAKQQHFVWPINDRRILSQMSFWNESSTVDAHPLDESHYSESAN